MARAAFALLLLAGVHTLCPVQGEGMWDLVQSQAVDAWEDARKAAVDIASEKLGKNAAYVKEGAKGAAQSDGAGKASEKVGKNAAYVKEGAQGAAQIVADAILQRTLNMKLADLPDTKMIASYGFFVFVFASFLASLWLGLGVWPALLLNLAVAVVGPWRTCRIMWAVLRVGVPFAAKHPSAFVVIVALMFVAGALCRRFSPKPRLDSAAMQKLVVELRRMAEEQTRQLNVTIARLAQIEHDLATATQGRGGKRVAPGSKSHTD